MSELPKSERASGLPQSSTVAIADLAARLRRQGESVIDFSAGRAVEHSPKNICAVAIDAISRGQTHQTEARGRPDYLEAIATKLQRENSLNVSAAENVIATLGCKQGLVLALFSSLDPGDEVIVEDPCFVSYEPTIRLAGGIPVSVPTRPENKFRWTKAELQAAITPKTKAILFCSPNNPTGVVHGPDDLQVIADVAIENNLLVIADEIYEAVTWEGRRHQCIYSLPGMQDRTLGLMGLTKSYSMGGWRIGYAYAAAERINTMVTLQQHLMTCANSFCQAGAAFALSEEATQSMYPLWSDWENRCRYLTAELDALPLLATRMPEGGFYAWVDIEKTGMASLQFAEGLLEEHKVAVVPGGSFGPSCDHYIRATCVRSWSDLREGVLRIKDFIQTLG